MTRKIELGPIGPDVDLDEEEYFTANGQRLTEKLAGEMAERALAEVARRRGRPSVTGAGARTPSLSVRVPSEVRDALESIADKQGRRLADVSREALEQYVERHAS